MLIMYFIVLLIAVVFKTLHFPFASLLLLISVAFPILDLIVQLIRKRTDKETRIWSAVSVIFWSIFLLFKFLYWPGAEIWFVLAGLFTFIYFLRVFQRRQGTNYRIYFVFLISVFSIFNFSIKKSTFKMLYMTEDPFNKEDQVPHFHRQSLAYEFYKEGDFEKAEQLIQLNIDHLNRLIELNTGTEQEKKNDKLNLDQSLSDLTMIQKRSWNEFKPLIREDRGE